MLPKVNPNSWRLMSYIKRLHKPEILPKISTIFRSNSKPVKQQIRKKLYRRAQHPTRQMSKARTENMKISRSRVVCAIRVGHTLARTGFLIWLSCSAINEPVLEWVLRHLTTIMPDRRLCFRSLCNAKNLYVHYSITLLRSQYMGGGLQASRAVRDNWSRNTTI
jgi:hypothetical protein